MVTERAKLAETCVETNSSVGVSLLLNYPCCQPIHTGIDLTQRDCKVEQTIVILKSIILMNLFEIQALPGKYNTFYRRSAHLLLPCLQHTSLSRSFQPKQNIVQNNLRYKSCVFGEHYFK